MATQTLVSFEEFLALPEEEARRYEYVDGELVEVATGAPDHNFVRDLFNHRLMSWWLEHRIGWIAGEVLFRLSNGRGYRPDIAWLRNRPENRIPLDCCPDLPIEIVSATDTAQDVERKVSDYLACGAAAVWVVPREREVTARSQSSTGKLRIGDTLTDEVLLPGFSLRLADLFIL